MGNWKRKTLSEEQESRVLDGIAKFEEATHSDLVVAIHPSSGPYVATTPRFAFAFLIFVLVLSGGKIPLSHILIYAALGVILGRMRAFKKLVRLPKEIRHRVHDQALKLFHLYHVHETSHRSGCFFFVSLEERKFVILVDRILAAKLASGALEGVVAKLTRHFKDQNFEAGLLEAMEELKAKFLEAFPAGIQRMDDRNELKNAVRWGHG